MQQIAKWLILTFNIRFSHNAGNPGEGGGRRVVDRESIEVNFQGGRGREGKEARERNFFIFGKPIFPESRRVVIFMVG